VIACAHDYEEWMDFDLRERRCKLCSVVDRELSPTYSRADCSEAAREVFISRGDGILGH
jgi:hypothetical protein